MSLLRKSLLLGTLTLVLSGGCTRANVSPPVAVTRPTASPEAGEQVLDAARAELQRLQEEAAAPRPTSTHTHTTTIGKRTYRTTATCRESVSRGTHCYSWTK